MNNHIVLIKNEKSRLREENKKNMERKSVEENLIDGK